MTTKTETTFALVNAETLKMTLDFGTSEQMMRDYLQQQYDLHGSYPRGIPMKITTVTTYEPVGITPNV